jgi:serine/threonine protein kinase
MQVTFGEDEVREAVAWSLLGLQYLHSSRKLHRDVKVGHISRFCHFVKVKHLVRPCYRLYRHVSCA